jgi:hypothetical protein
MAHPNPPKAKRAENIVAFIFKVPV